MISHAHHPSHSSDTWLAGLRRTLTGGHAPTLAVLSDDYRGSLLDAACAALRRGDFDTVESVLARGGDAAHADAACLNLLGIVCEARRRWRDARRFYGRAMRAERAFAPAEQNMRRLYELDTFGHSRLPLAVGDATTDLLLARLLTRRAN